MASPKVRCTRRFCDFFLSVQTNPLNDSCGITALTGANIMFELLCVLPGVKYANLDHIMKNNYVD